MTSAHPAEPSRSNYCKRVRAVCRTDRRFFSPWRRFHRFVRGLLPRALDVPRGGRGGEGGGGQGEGEGEITPVACEGRGKLYKRMGGTTTTRTQLLPGSRRLDTARAAAGPGKEAARRRGHVRGVGARRMIVVDDDASSPRRGETCRVVLRGSSSPAAAAPVAAATAAAAALPPSSGPFLVGSRWPGAPASYYYSRHAGPPPSHCVPAAAAAPASREVVLVHPLLLRPPARRTRAHGHADTLTDTGADTPHAPTALSQDPSLRSAPPGIRQAT